MQQYKIVNLKGHPDPEDYSVGDIVTLVKGCKFNPGDEVSRFIAPDKRHDILLKGHRVVPYSSPASTELVIQLYPL